MWRSRRALADERRAGLLGLWSAIARHRKAHRDLSDPGGRVQDMSQPADPTPEATTDLGVRRWCTHSLPFLR